MGLAALTLPEAILGAGAVAGTAGVASSVIGSNAQENAARTAATNQQDIYHQNQQLLNPYVQGGLGAYSTLNNLLGVGGNSQTMQDTLNNLPGYQFTLGQGLKSVQNSVAARGLGDSGAALKGAANYATGLANANYGQYAGLLQNSANTGYGAGAAIAGVGAQTGAQVGGSNIAGGNAAAAGALGAGNSIANAANSVPGNLLLANYLGGGYGGGGTIGNGGGSVGADYSLSAIP